MSDKVHELKPGLPDPLRDFEIAIEEDFRQIERLVDGIVAIAACTGSDTGTGVNAAIHAIALEIRERTAAIKKRLDETS
jgi:hypothetical protein